MILYCTRSVFSNMFTFSCSCTDSDCYISEWAGVVPLIVWRILQIERYSSRTCLDEPVLQHCLRYECSHLNVCDVSFQQKAKLGMKIWLSGTCVFPTLGTSSESKTRRSEEVWRGQKRTLKGMHVCAAEPTLDIVEGCCCRVTRHRKSGWHITYSKHQLV